MVWFLFLGFDDEHMHCPCTQRVSVCWLGSSGKRGRTDQVNSGLQRTLLVTIFDECKFGLL